MGLSAESTERQVTMPAPPRGEFNNITQAKTTTSAKKLTDYMKLNVRATIEPCDKYSEPVTSNMAYGWGTRIPQ
jgi:hypothetical protein